MEKLKRIITDVNQSLIISRSESLSNNAIEINRKQANEYKLNFLPIKHKRKDYYDYEKR